MSHRRLFATLFAALLIVPASAVPAFAASATQDAYGDDGVLNDNETGTNDDTQPDTQDASPSTTSNGSLPFTGLEAGLIAAAGIGLAGTGIVLRRSTREQ